MLAQEELKQRSRTNYRGEKKYATDYSGYLYCGDCGAPMFSLSRRDLAPAYTCGTYHRRGRKGCTSHHIRVDKLDEILKEYIRLVRDHSSSMIDQLEQAIQQQPEREQEIGDAIGSLEQQMEKAQAELKQMYKRKLLDTMGKSPEQTAIIEEAYADLESDLLHRITGLERQIKDGIDAHNRLVKTNRVAKTVLEVFDDILNKPKLDKQDIALIVDRITVYEQRIDIQLKADIDGLLSAIEQENTANFREDSKDITKKTVKIVQSAARRPDKVFTVNVINDGDPLEIYTDRDGEVIFKKYSPMGELGSFVGELAEALSRTAGLSCAICDRDAVIAAAGGARKEIFEKTISTELENLMEQRHIYEHTGSDTVVSVSGSDPYHVVVAAPIITEGDVTGCVAFLSEEDVQPTEVETKLSQTAASFLAKHVTM